MALNAFQKKVADLAKRLGLKGSAESQVYSRPEYQQLLKEQFGDIQLPAGVTEDQVISRDNGQVTYRDSEGYEHRLTRNLDGNSPDLGRVREESTNRPAVLPSSADPRNKSTMDAATRTILQILGVNPDTVSNPVQEEGQDFFGLPTTGQTGQQGVGQLGNLSPADKALLDAMTKADLDQVRQQFQTTGGKLVASLYARGLNESSLANDAASRFAQDQGLVESRVLADASAREMNARQFLTQLATGASTDLIKAMLDADTTRGVASGQIGLGKDQLDQQIITDNRNYLLEDRKLKLQEQAQSPWRSILSTVASLGAAAIPGIGPALSGVIGGVIGGSGQRNRTDITGG